MTPAIRDILIVGLVAGLLAYFVSVGLAVAFLFVAAIILLATGGTARLRR